MHVRIVAQNLEYVLSALVLCLVVRRQTRQQRHASGNNGLTYTGVDNDMTGPGPMRDIAVDRVVDPGQTHTSVSTTGMASPAASTDAS